jgi:hypothetical protein
MRLSKREREAVHDAIDFIETNIDGADDNQLAIHRVIIKNLSKIIEKSKKDRYRELVRSKVKQLKGKE